MTNKFVTRAYNRFEKNDIKGTITKFSKEIKLKKEADYVQELPSDLGIFFPRVTKSGFQNTSQEYFMEMEYYPYSNLSDALYFDIEDHWPDFIAKHIFSILKEFEKFKSPTPLEVIDLKAIYIDKTETEQQRLINQFYTPKRDPFNFLNTFSTYDEVVINDKTYENFHIIWPKIKANYGQWLTMKRSGSVIHGDLCFSNILCYSSFVEMTPIIKFIDPRGEFGKHKIYGDPYYDLAKLYHSTNTGYELIINDKFKIEGPEFQGHGDDNFSKRINFSFDASLEKKKAVVHQHFQQEIYSHYDINKIKLIEGLLYISMAGRHYDSVNRQKVMYASGIKILNEVFETLENLPDDGYH